MKIKKRYERIILRYYGQLNLETDYREECLNTKTLIRNDVYTGRTLIKDLRLKRISMGHEIFKMDGNKVDDIYYSLFKNGIIYVGQINLNIERYKISYLIKKLRSEGLIFDKILYKKDIWKLEKIGKVIGSDEKS